MNISKKSWHYKIVDYSSDSVPDNLCGYTQIIFKIILCVLISLVTAAFLSFIIGDKIAADLNFFANNTSMLYALLCIGLGLLSIIVAASLLFAIVGAGVYLTEKLAERAKKRKDGVITSYIKSKNEKICLKLNFTED